MRMLTTATLPHHLNETETDMETFTKTASGPAATMHPAPRSTAPVPVPSVEEIRRQIGWHMLQTATAVR
jgi:hypothetical protein